jgi:hypothetical protein
LTYTNKSTVITERRRKPLWSGKRMGSDMRQIGLGSAILDPPYRGLIGAGRVTRARSLKTFSSLGRKDGRRQRARSEGVGPSVSRTRHYGPGREKSVVEDRAGIPLTRLTPDFFPTFQNFLGHENV